MAEIVATFKGDTQPPWLVVHAETVEELGEIIVQLRDGEVMPVIHAAAEEYAAMRTPPNLQQAIGNVQAAMPGSQVIGQEPNQWPQGSIGAQYGGQQLPQQYQPGGNAPTCLHGPMQYVANGQYGPFWACPLPKGTPGKCKARNAR